MQQLLTSEHSSTIEKLVET